jgi:hypothetical protein
MRWWSTARLLDLVNSSTWQDLALPFVRHALALRGTRHNWVFWDSRIHHGATTFTPLYLYAAPLDVGFGVRYSTRAECPLSNHRTETIQYAVCGFLRIYLPRTPVNRGAGCERTVPDLRMPHAQRAMGVFLTLGAIGIRTQPSVPPLNRRRVAYQPAGYPKGRAPKPESHDLTRHPRRNTHFDTFVSLRGASMPRTGGDRGGW